MEIQVREHPAQTVLYVRRRIRTDQIGEQIGAAYGQIFGAMGSHGIDAEGEPYARWPDWVPESAECILEAGVPVADDAPTPAGLERGTLGGGRVATALFVGKYDDLGAAQGEIAAFIQAEGLSPSGPPWEVYLNHDEENPEASETLLYWPVG